MLSFLMHTWRQDNSDSLTQERVGHMLSTKTHITHYKAVGSGTAGTALAVPLFPWVYLGL